MEKKFKRILSCLFGERGKVQFRRKKLGDKVRRKVQICLAIRIAVEFEPSPVDITYLIRL